jgi:hypothetical protein
MHKSLPLLAAAYLACLAAPARAGGLLFRQYREPTSCRLLGGEVLLVPGRAEWLSATDLYERFDATSLLAGPLFRRSSPRMTRRIDFLPKAELDARCAQAETGEQPPEFTPVVTHAGSEVVAATLHPTWGNGVGQAGEPTTDSLLALESPALGGGGRSAGFVDSPADPAMVLRLALLLVVGWFPPMLRGCMQRGLPLDSARPA